MKQTLAGSMDNYVNKDKNPREHCHVLVGSKSKTEILFSLCLHFI